MQRFCLSVSRTGCRTSVSVLPAAPRRFLGRLRAAAIVRISDKKPVKESADLKGFDITKNYGDDVFGYDAMRKMLPASAFNAIQKAIENRTFEILDVSVADAVANAMKVWAMERGATHFSHWFQPMTGYTAEKHDAFIKSFLDGSIPLMTFKGSQLMKGEADGSSFPSGGIRTTFEARGYTAWDPSSPAFLRRHANGNTLCIPTAFCSWDGHALDQKTPLLRSERVISQEALRTLQLLGDKKVKSVFTTIGVEQEFFLVDRDYVMARPDLIAAGRTVMGRRPAKGQQMEDQYFGSINPRVVACLQEVEKAAWRLAIPTRTRHNEVAPAQFELAPTYEYASLAADHNMLLMDLLGDIAARHGFECLLHEKPFAGVNGSGKHVNWALCTSDGQNLLDPGANPESNMRFMYLLAATLKAVDQNSCLLRAASATFTNDLRLGGNEAPPVIMSVFIGQQLENAVNQLLGAKHSDAAFDAFVKLGVSALPAITRDYSDRNRTSPFAFTGDKWEFRSVGSSQSPSTPIRTLNTIIAKALRVMNDELEQKLRSGVKLNEAVQEVVTKNLKQHQRILFGGDGYSMEWRDEAAKRGLPVFKDTPEVMIAAETTKGQDDLFAEMGVLTTVESKARTHIALENYAKSANIEASLTHSMSTQQVLPAAIKYQETCAKAISAVKAADPQADTSVQQKELSKLTSTISGVIENAAQLKQKIDAAHKLKNATPADEALYFRDQVLPVMQAVRKGCDALEGWVDDSHWPLPKYSEMMFCR